MLKTALVLAVLAAAPLALSSKPCAASEQPIAIVTDGMSTALRSRLEAKAQEGPRALVQYIHRTRNVHNLRVDDVVRKPDREQLARMREQGRLVAFVTAK